MTTPVFPYLLRVEKGFADPEELAALSVVLLARAAYADAAHADVFARRPDVAGWRRPERAFGFEGPRAWRGAGGPA